jgi:ankyrin repeat protein
MELRLLHGASAKGHAPMTELLIVARCNIRCNIDFQAKNGCVPLYVAAHHGHAAVTEQSLQRRNVNLQEKDEFTPLQPPHRGEKRVCILRVRWQHGKSEPRLR